MRNPIALLSGSWSLIRQNIPLYFGIVIFPTLLSYLASIFMPPQNTGVVNLDEWSVYMVLLALSVIASIFMTIAITLALANPSMTIGQAYRASAGFFWRYLGLSIVMSILLAIAYILLIIPGIILSVWFAFAMFVLVLENASIKESLRRSREYVRGRWWGVFGRIVVVTGFVFIVGIMFGILGSLVSNQMLAELLVLILNLIILPPFMGYLYLMYRDASGGSTPAYIAEGQA